MTNKRQAAKARTQQRILEVARRLFAAQGYNATTTRQIADEAGMSTGAIFANWSSLDALWIDATGLEVPGSRPPRRDGNTAKRAKGEFWELLR